MAKGKIHQEKHIRFIISRLRVMGACAEAHLILIFEAVSSGHQN